MTDKRLYLLDFDGTLTRKDTLFIFMRYFGGFYKFLLITILFSPLFALVKIGVLKASKIKLMYINAFLKKKSVKTTKHKLEQFDFKDILFKEAYLFLEDICSSPINDVYIVSASIELWLHPMTIIFPNLKIIGTKYEQLNGIFQGSFNTPNCNGIEKVVRINESIDLDKYSEIHVYGNSSGDKPMMKLGTHSKYKYFGN